jgi:sigma-B regulation protein RsbU (phosphoserine phosphatase)
MSPPRRARRRRTIRSRLLLTLNLVMGAGLAVLLAADYRRELDQRIDEKHNAMREEAITLLPSIVALRGQGFDVVQDHVDLVCSRMQETTSPGHHIGVRMGDAVLQARAHGRASDELLRAMESAADSPRARADSPLGPIVVGSTAQDDVRVYVAESVRNIRASARGLLIRRTLGLSALGILGGLVVNLILLRLVAHPLDRLVHTVRQIGAGHVGAQAQTFNTAELDFLAREINAMSASLARTEKERDRQFHKARRIQEHLGPHADGLPGLRLAHLYEPATEITGDYYDLLKLADGSWLLCVADVCGHGVPAAMEAAVLKALLLAAAETTGDPAAVLAAVNERLGTVTLPEDFATMVLLRWDPQRREVRYASAGHETCYYLARRGDTIELNSTGPVLGVGLRASWPSGLLRMDTGDKLILLTDGVPDTMSPQGRRFGRDRACRVLAEHRAAGPAETLEALAAALARHRAGKPLTDDVTVLAVEVADAGPAPGGATRDGAAA